jgi:Holliday junction resolvase
VDFISYLTPESRELIQLVSQKGYAIRENASACRNREIFGVVNDKSFVICLDNIKNKISPVKRYVNETVIHEAVHIAQLCKGGKLGINVSLSQYKMQDVKNSVRATGSNAIIEKEAYHLEDKPEQVLAFLKKYCL